MKTVIMAGGKGTRISSVAMDIPKPMIPINGIPVLEHEIRCLRKQGFVDIIVTVGYLGNIIIDYFGDGSKISKATGEPFGVHIDYFIEKEPLGNAGALFYIKDKLKEDFLLLNADSVFDIDFERFVKYHKKCGGYATIFTHPNSHPYDSGLIVVDDNNSVIKWLTKEAERPEFYQNRVNAGIHILSPTVFGLMEMTLTHKVDLDRQILKPLEGTGRLYAYDSPEYVADMGTPERYKKVCDDFKRGLPQKMNLRNKQKAIFLDRDGTINKYVGFLTDKSAFELLPGVASAIHTMNEMGYLVIVVTNQPVIARGDITKDELKEIHNKMETLLGMEETYITAIYYCPHHPDKGYEGEITELKIQCDCRKPKPGMLFKAEKDYNLELAKCWMVGDKQEDVLAGKNAGCKTALLGKEEFGQDITVNSLREFIEKVIKDFES